MIVNTRNGLFANAGYGGGTFNGNKAFGAYDRKGKAMRQQRYQDVSNLNAPYDNLSVQGLGVLGGGVLGGSLGAEETSTIESSALPTASSAPTIGDYPWLVESPSTLAVQVSTNKQLKAEGYNLLLADGKLGPRTCGALSKYGALGMVYGACDSHTSEFIAPTKAVAATVTDPKDASSASGGSGGVPVWLWAVLAGTGAVGIAIYLKNKKKHRS